MSLRIIAGQFKGRKLKAPKISTTRPTQSMVREAVFNICQNEIVGARFLDLFAGSGLMAFEALSRGANHCTLIEQNRISAGCIKQNIQELKVEDKLILMLTDAKKGIDRLAKQHVLFDIIYIDPPYRMAFDLKLITGLVVPNGLIFLEEGQDHKKEFPEELKLESTKKFGSTILSTFTLK